MVARNAVKGNNEEEILMIQLWSQLTGKRKTSCIERAIFSVPNTETKEACWKRIKMRYNLIIWFKLGIYHLQFLFVFSQSRLQEQYFFQLLQPFSFAPVLVFLELKGENPENLRRNCIM